MAPTQDIELNTINNFELKEDSLTRGSSYSTRGPAYSDTVSSRLQSFFDGFKREPNTFFPRDAFGRLESADLPQNHAPYYDLRLATFETAHPGLARKLKGRHLQMIAIGGSIGMHREAPSW